MDQALTINQRRPERTGQQRVGADQGVGMRSQGSCGKPMKFYARHPLILLKKSSAAGSSHESVYRDYRAGYGVEPICKRLPIAPSTYYLHAARKANPQLRSTRAKLDDNLGTQIRRLWEANFQAYGARKAWLQVRRKGQDVARCTVERLTHKLGLQGVVRGKRVKTTIRRPDDAYPLDRVNRRFTVVRPNALWMADFTYVSTWQGFVYAAFVIDVFFRFIVGWQISSSARTDFVLGALGQALYIRKPDGGLIRYTDRLAEASTEVSAGSVGGSYGNALAENH
jgi:putative transposase